MCRWRHVRNLYLKCGHAESLANLAIVSRPSRSSAEAPTVNLARTTQLGVSLRLATGGAINIRPTNFSCRTTLTTEQLPMWTRFVRLVPALWAVATKYPRRRNGSSRLQLAKIGGYADDSQSPTLRKFERYYLLSVLGSTSLY
ncbi:hypothetical protein B0H11DRAFT_1908883 [Mycena galericulata]|nr:hypothetical protein B0H11DRAFT_1908883 [Mycena galericulata]